MDIPSSDFHVGVLRRTAAHLEEDVTQMRANFESKRWKDWPNEAGFEDLTEERGPILLKVKGRIPAYAAGTLYRTGPGVSQVETTLNGKPKTHYVSHWFDGFAQTHKFDIFPPDSEDEPVTVSYSSRRQSEKFIESVRQKGWRSSISFGQRADPCVGLFAKVMGSFEPRQRNNSVVIASNVPGLGRNPLPSPPPSPNHETGMWQKQGPIGPLGHRKNKLENLWVFTDNANLQELDPSTLEPLGEADQSALHPSLKGPLSCAHMQKDPETGDCFNYNLELGRQPTYRIFRTNASTGRTDILATLSGPDFPPAYIHSFFLTENYVVLTIPSSHFTWSGMGILWQRNLIDAIKPFDQKTPWQWIVIDRKQDQGVVGRFTTPGGFFFHSSNAFEERRLVPSSDSPSPSSSSSPSPSSSAATATATATPLSPETRKEDNGTGEAAATVITDLNFDLIMYDTSDIMHAFYYDVVMNRDKAAEDFWIDKGRYKTCQPRFTRYTYRLPPCQSPRKTISQVTTPTPTAQGTRGKVTTRAASPITTDAEDIPVGQATESISIPAPHVGDMPAISPLRLTKPARYLYSCAARGFSTMTDCLAKTDLETGESLQWVGGKGHTAGEPVFVPNPDPEGTREEDDGVVLSVVLDGEGRRSYLVCLDGETMEEVGRVEMDFAVCHGFHGIHEGG